MLAGKFENETEPWLGRYFEQKICWEFCKISVGSWQNLLSFGWPAEKTNNNSEKHAAIKAFDN